MPVCANFDFWPSTKCDYGNCSWVESGLMELDFENNILNQAADQLGPGFLLRIGGTLADHVQFDHTETENPGWGKCTCKGSCKNALPKISNKNIQNFKKKNKTRLLKFFDFPEIMNILLVSRNYHNVLLFSKTLF